MQHALQTLVKGSDQDIEQKLPKLLNKILNKADTCRDLANDVNEKFQGVMNLICELLEACVVAQKEYKDRDEETNDAIKVVILLNMSVTNEWMNEWMNEFSSIFERTLFLGTMGSYALFHVTWPKSLDNNSYLIISLDSIVTRMMIKTHISVPES